MADLDEELLRRQEEFEARQQQDRLEAMQRPGQMDAAKEYAQKAAGRAVRRYGMKIAGKAAARYGIIPVLTATFPIWGTILGVLLGAMLVLIILIAGCNQTGLSGLGVRGLSRVAGIFGADVCRNLTFSGGPVVNKFGPSSLGKLTDAEARALLAQAGITVNHPQPQTSLEGIERTTIAEVITLKANCTNWSVAAGRGSCNIQVTGGTERGAGHVESGSCSHINGQKIDVAGLGLDAYINANFGPPTGHRSNGDALYSVNGKEYAREFDHWDIAVCLT
jgi:hypothetical protein